MKQSNTGLLERFFRRIPSARITGLLAITCIALLSACNDRPTTPIRPSGPAVESTFKSSSGTPDASLWDFDGDGVLNDLEGVDLHSADLPVETGQPSTIADLEEAVPGMTVIDFESPRLGSSPWMFIDPYVDASTGVTFTAVPDTFFGGDDVHEGTLGIVYNLGTSACVDPPDSNQKLASGVYPYGVGRSGFRLQAEFPDELPCHSLLSVEFQSGASRYGTIWLYDQYREPTGYVSEILEPGIGRCGNEGELRGRKVVSLVSTGPVKYVVMDVRWGSISAFVFAIDDFSFVTSAGFVLDIKPGSDVNPMNPRSRGVVPVAILGSESSDVSRINASTLRLEGIAPIRTALKDIGAPISCGACDHSSESADGYMDMQLLFSMSEIVDSLGPKPSSWPQSLELTGELDDGISFVLWDCITTVGSTLPDLRVVSPR